VNLEGKKEKALLVAFEEGGGGMTHKRPKKRKESLQLGEKKKARWSFVDGGPEKKDRYRKRLFVVRAVHEEEKSLREGLFQTLK